jgi:hypothetical protein
VGLPTVPPRRVIDAGYYDNYGVNLASDWLDQHADWLARNTSGVVLIQIRPFTNEEGLRDLTRNVVEVQTRDKETALGFLTTLPGRALQFFTSPLDGLSASRPAIAYYRNDEQVALLAQRFRHLTGDRDFFQTVVFTCGVETSSDTGDVDAIETLSWAIGPSEVRRIFGGMDSSRKNQERLAALTRWWKIEHGDCPIERVGRDVAPQCHGLQLTPGASPARPDRRSHFATAAEHHGHEPDVSRTCRLLASWSRRNRGSLAPPIERYGETRESEPDALHRALFHGPRSGGLGLVRDLHDLWLLAQEVRLAYELLMQAARSLRASDVEAILRDSSSRTGRQADRLRARIDQAAPRALTVPS